MACPGDCWAHSSSPPHIPCASPESASLAQAPAPRAAWREAFEDRQRRGECDVLLHEEGDQRFHTRAVQVEIRQCLLQMRRTFVRLLVPVESVITPKPC